MSDRSTIKPPRLPERILEWYCGHSNAEDLLGDMEEIFYSNLNRMSATKAKYQYWGQAMALLFSYTVKKRRQISRFSGSSSSILGGIDIFRSYSKVAFRSLAKHKFFTIINILGLAIGMSVGLMALGAFVDTLEADRFNVNGKEIYRVNSEVDDLDRKRIYASSSAPLAQFLSNEVPGIKNVVRFNKSFNPIVVSGKERIPIQGYFTDPSFFEVFSFQLLEGDIRTALSMPFSMVITQSAAEKLFYQLNPVGQMVTVEGMGEFQITGLVKDFPRSHLLFETLTSYQTLESLESMGVLNKGGKHLRTGGPSQTITPIFNMKRMVT